MCILCASAPLRVIFKRAPKALTTHPQAVNMKQPPKAHPMPLLFSYGTLQQENIQQQTFGRLLQGQPDALPGYELSSVKIRDPQVAAAMGMTHFANAIPSANPNSQIPGTLFEITEAELAAADQYEQADHYQRKLVT